MEKKCRSCLSTESLFCWNDCITEKVSYSDIFFRITYFDRQLFPEMNWLCTECGEDILNIYNFIRKATEAECKLKQELYIRTLENMKDETEINKPTNSVPDLTNILAQIDHSKITIKRIDFQEIENNDGIRENSSIFKHLQTKIQKDEVNDEEEYLSENVVYQDGEEEVLTDLGFEPIDIELVEEVEEVNEYNDQIQERYDNENDYEDNDKTDHDYNYDSEMQENTSDNLETESNCNRKNTKNRTKASKDCQYCGKSFSTAWSKNNHVMAIHGEQERSLCDECPRTFRDIWTLAKHKKTHDKNRKREYVCSICDLTFLTSGSLKGHMELHDANRVKKFQCDQCEKAFFQRGALNVHKRLHDDSKLIQCEYCDKRYPRVCDLEKHLLTHTGDMPFQCKFCRKLFKYSSSLYTHMRREHFGYIYKCSYCSKQFEEKEALNEHKMMHKLTPYKCALCDKEATKKMRIKNHIKEVHKIEDIEEIEQNVISSKPQNTYRRMRKFVNVTYEKCTEG